MGWLGSGLTFPVNCLILVWAAGSGSVKVLHQPTCLSDYLYNSTCEWKMDGPTNCSAELRLSYKLNFLFENYLICVPENRGSAVCVCYLPMEDAVSGDIYQLNLWAGEQLLWNGFFRPSDHVKPKAPENLTIHANVSHEWQLTWSNPYPSDNFLYSKLCYMVIISNENDPTDFKIFNVTYLKSTLSFPVNALKFGASYSIRMRAWAPRYNSTWSEWSPSIRLLNYYEWPWEQPWEQRLPLAVSISCIVILVIFLSCYFSITRIKKQWWDQIPNPAHSLLMDIVIQEPQVSLWGKQTRGQEPAKCPHWKTCLTKLLPCLLEHGIEKDDNSSKAARNGPFQGPGKLTWCPVEVSKTILWPESISVVKCVELFEAQVESEGEEAEEDKGSFCPSPESSGGSFQEARKGIAARLTESLFLDLLGVENGGFCPQGLGESCLLPPSESVSTQMPWAEFPSSGPQEATFQGKEQPVNPGSNPPATVMQSPDCLAFMEVPTVIADNPAYRSFSNFLSQSSGPGELDSGPQLAERLGVEDRNIPPDPQPSEPPAALQPEPETWEQVLRRSVLQHRAAIAPASAPTSGYREFVHAVKQGSAQGGGAVGFGPSGEAGYKAFSSLLASSAICPGSSGVEANSGEGGYRPFQSLTPGCPEAPASIPVPLFTFGLDMELPHSPQSSLLPSSSPECLILEPVAKGEDSQKSPLSPEQATDPLRDDLGSGIVYSALTCHLCGQLKQCHGQEERGKAHIVTSPCCGCCHGDRSSPLTSPLRAPDTSPGGVLLEASLPTAALAPLGVSEEGKSSLFFQPAHSNAQSSSQTPKMVTMLSTKPTCVSAS